MVWRVETVQKNFHLIIYAIIVISVLPGVVQFLRPDEPSRMQAKVVRGRGSGMRAGRAYTRSIAPGIECPFQVVKRVRIQIASQKCGELETDQSFAWRLPSRIRFR